MDEKLRMACESVLGNVGAISPVLYNLALKRIAEMTGRENNEEFKKEVAKILETLSCSID